MQRPLKTPRHAQDVEQTHIDWLINKYKQYMLLRDQLLRDIPQFRSKVMRRRRRPSSLCCTKAALVLDFAILRLCR